MKELIAGFSQQLRNAVQIAKTFQLASKPNVKINNVLICGLGGSGIGGTIVKNILYKTSTVNIEVHKDYALPAYVNENTLVICSSYSGNTEETLDAFQSALEKKTQIAVISSGGTLIEWAQNYQIPYIQIPGGSPPRANLGYSITQLFKILYLYQITTADNLEAISKIADELDEMEENIKAEAQNLASKIHQKIPILYSEGNIEGVAVRWRQQINENSKMLCWHHIIPEMNHNELVGWAETQINKLVLFLRTDFEHERSKHRIQLVDEIVKQYTSVLHLPAKGKTLLEQVFYLIHLGDWVSYFLSEHKGVDATEIKVIDYLKGKLADL